MTPSSNLRKLHMQAKGRLTRLRCVTLRRVADAIYEDTEARIAYVTIEMLSTWANFSRCFFISCLGHAKTASGLKALPARRCYTENEAIGRAVKFYNPTAQPRADGGWNRYDEPTWHNPKTLLDLAADQCLSNLSAIQAGFSTNDRTFELLPVCRNFFAHRSRLTERAAQAVAQKYGIQSSLRPSQIMLSRPMKRHQLLVFEWLDHIEHTIEFLCT